MSINVVTFEADAQRQHQRYKLPLKCVIDGYRYSCFDWSLGGAGVATGRTVLPEFKTFPIELEFPFDDFVISIKLMAEVRYCHPGKGRTGLQYVSPTDANLRFFRYIRDAYINGDLVTGNEMIDFSSRMIEPRSRKKEAPPIALTRTQRLRATVGRSLRIGATAAAGLALLVFLWGALYDRLWTFRADESLVAIDSSSVVSPTDGIVTNIVTHGAVKAGEPVATILPSANGQSVTVFARCDCVVQDVEASLDSQVRTGERLLSLSMQNVRPHVVAMVDYAQALRLYQGARVLVELPHGGSIDGAQIRELPKLSSADLTSDSKIPVNIDVGDANLDAIVGAPVVVRFVQAPWTTTGGTAAAKGIVSSTAPDRRRLPGAEG
jgi:alginate biosynthesis protein Alg44